jgi:hypothetical protein
VTKIVVLDVIKLTKFWFRKRAIEVAGVSGMLIFGIWKRNLKFLWYTMED